MSTVIGRLQSKELLSRLTHKELLELLDILADVEPDSEELKQAPLSIDPRAQIFLQQRNIDLADADEGYNVPIRLISRALRIDPGQEALVVNGRVRSQVELSYRKTDI